MRLTREVRCFLTQGNDAEPVLNSWAGWPASDSLDPFVVLRVTVEGTPDERTGYLCDTESLDALLRSRAVAILRDRLSRERVRFGAAGALLEVFAAVAAGCEAPATLHQLELALSPFTRLACRAGESPMVRMTQSFEFSAAHRLYCPNLSDEENFQLFGKCANPNGHGHNYVVEVTVGGEVDADKGAVIELDRFQRTVRERVIDRFDHTHLNLDCEEFASLNPSVENIARVIWGRLFGQLDPARLYSVRVWETPKTSAEYTGD